MDEDDTFYVAAFCAIDKIANIETYQAFKKKYEVVGAGVTYGVTYKDGDIEQAWIGFKSRITALKAKDATALKAKDEAISKVVTSLQGFSAVLDYESNRPYQYWYDTKPHLMASGPTEGILRTILKEEKYTPKEIKNYLRAVVRPAE